VKAINESAALNADKMVHVVDADQSSDVRYHTIEEAIQNANENDCIIVRSGVYALNETLNVTKPIHLRGAFEMDGGRKTVRICMKSPSDAIIHIQNTYSQQFQISHVTLCPYDEATAKQHKKVQKKNPDTINGSNDTNGASDKFKSQCCIRISGGSKCKMEDVEVYGSTGQGIVVENSGQLTVEHSLITGNTQNGIVATGSAILNIKHTTIQANGFYGMLAKDAAEVSITESNFSENLSHPIRHESSHRMYIAKNEICTTKEPHISMKQGSVSESTENHLTE
jgi:hypothetical protein